MPFDPTTILWTAVIAIAGWLIVHRLTRSREREFRELDKRETQIAARTKRKNELLQFLKVWEHEIRSGLGVYHKVSNSFDERKRELVRFTSIMTTDYSPDFSAKVKIITGITSEVGSMELDKDRGELKGVRKLLNAVQDLIAFVEAN